MRKKYLIDLFGGCGGLSLGLEQAGFTNILFNEINHSAALTYRKNVINPHPAFKFIEDARDLLGKGVINNLRHHWKEHNINEIDLLVGGPPCWGYSNIGLRRTFDTDKKNIGTNHLYKVMVEIIKLVQPRIFMFENVKGLLTAKWEKSTQKGEIWRDVQDSFNKIDGYTIQSELVFCYNYGVPQNRPRVIMVGIKDDLGWKDISCKPCFGRLPDKIEKPVPTILDAIGDLVDPNYLIQLKTSKYPSRAKTEFQRELRSVDGKILRKGERVFNHDYSKHSERIIRKFDHMIKNNGIIPNDMRTKKFSQKVLPAKWKNCNPNITVTSLPDDYVHFSQPRSLTVREWARLQTFPDNFVFYGPRTTGGRRRAGDPSNNFEKRDIPQYTQIGNAVPVAMARSFGKHFMKILDGNDG